MDDTPNYTEKSEDRSMDGYTVRIRENKIRPENGSGPLTVVEFSLTNEIRDSLKSALDDYLKRHSGTLDDQELGVIIAAHIGRVQW